MESVCQHDATLQHRNELITNHIPLANKLAWSKWKQTPKCVGIEELKSAAYMGLVDAADKFDESRNVTFAAYARIRIQGAILDYLRELSWGRRDDPTVPVSIDFSVDDSKRFSLADLVATEDSKDSQTMEFFEEITKAIPAIGSQVLLLYYIDNLSLKEIGNMIGVGESRVSQMLSRCRKLIEQKWSRGDLWVAA